MATTLTYASFPGGKKELTLDGPATLSSIAAKLGLDLTTFLNATFTVNNDPTDDPDRVITEGSVVVRTERVDAG